MRKIYSLFAIALFAAIVSCTDDDLDPLNSKKVLKGTLLAVRGDFLNAIYNDGVPGASFVPLITDGTDVFSYDAEFLSDNPSSLQSIDVFVEDKDGVRTALKSYQASDFKTGDTGRPFIKVSATLAEILPKIGINTTYPLDAATVKELLDDYGASGINIVTDINLTDGTKVLADDMVSPGLYQSDQFYPAMRLPFVVVKYCVYDDEDDDWSGSYKGLEILSNDTNGPNTYTFTKTGTDKYHVAGVYGAAGKTAPIEFDIQFKPSTKPTDQLLFDVAPTTVGTKTFAATKGTYEQCTHTLTFAATFTDAANKVTKFTYQFKRK